MRWLLARIPKSEHISFIIHLNKAYLVNCTNCNHISDSFHMNFVIFEYYLIFFFLLKIERISQFKDNEVIPYHTLCVWQWNFRRFHSIWYNHLHNKTEFFYATHLNSKEHWIFNKLHFYCMWGIWKYYACSYSSFLATSQCLLNSDPRGSR